MDLEQKDLNVFHIFFHSGERTAGKIVNRMNRKRINQGILYLTEGSVVFSQQGKEDKVVLANDIVIIPKGQRYCME